MLTTTATRHLLRVVDLTSDDLDELLDLAAAMKRDPYGWTTALPGRSVVSVFEKPSTRTRVSFAAAAHRLGMQDQVLRPDELQIGRGETIADTARVLSRYAAAITLRTFDHATVAELAAHATVPVVNALSDAHHPCQALADLLTLRERFGRLRHLRVLYVGDANNVAHSLMEGAALTGMHLVVCCPEGYDPDPVVLADTRLLAREHGGSVSVTRDPRASAVGAHAIYTDVWVSMGDEADAERRRRDLVPYQVDAALLDEAEDDCVLLHCLPAHRGLEVTADALDGPRSAVFDQAENRLHTEMALLHRLITAAEGSRS